MNKCLLRIILGWYCLIAGLRDGIERVPHGVPPPDTEGGEPLHGRKDVGAKCFFLVAKIAGLGIPTTEICS